MIKKQNLSVSDYQKSERDFAFIIDKENLNHTRFRNAISNIDKKFN